MKVRLGNKVKNGLLLIIKKNQPEWPLQNIQSRVTLARRTKLSTELVPWKLLELCLVCDLERSGGIIFNLRL